MAEYDVQLKDFKSLFALDGKVAVVTGGSRGLGLNAAAGLLQAGCKLVFITSRKSDACEEACKHLNNLQGKRSDAKAIPIAADSSKIEEIERLVAEVGKHTDHVDILFANAGATWGAPFEEHSDKSFAKVMDLNVKSVFFCIQKFTPLLAAKATIEEPSRVIATGSIAGQGIGSTGQNSVPAYTASKAAVIHLMRHCAIDLAPRHILCNAIAPGFFPTRLSNGLIEIAGGVDKLAKENPTGRLGRPEDVAGAVVYLASRASGHVNGGVIAMDGGQVWARAQL